MSSIFLNIVKTLQETANDKQALLVVFTVIFTVIYVYSAKQVLLRMRDKRRTTLVKLNNTISSGLLNGTIDSTDDLINIYKGVHGLGTDDASYRAGLSKALRKYLVEIVSDNSINSDEAKRIKALVNKFLGQLECEAPFADLPTAERNLVIDIKKFTDANDKISVNHKLEDLAGLIEIRHDALTKLQALNKWSIPLAIIGLVLTVVFGVVSLLK